MSWLVRTRSPSEYLPWVYVSIASTAMEIEHTYDVDEVLHFADEHAAQQCAMSFAVQYGLCDEEHAAEVVEVDDWLEFQGTRFQALDTEPVGN